MPLRTLKNWLQRSFLYFCEKAKPLRREGLSQLVTQPAVQQPPSVDGSGGFFVFFHGLPSPRRLLFGVEGLFRKVEAVFFRLSAFDFGAKLAFFFRRAALPGSGSWNPLLRPRRRRRRRAFLLPFSPSPLFTQRRFFESLSALEAGSSVTRRERPWLDSRGNWVGVCATEARKQRPLKRIRRATFQAAFNQRGPPYTRLLRRCSFTRSEVSPPHPLHSAPSSSPLQLATLLKGPRKAAAAACLAAPWLCLWTDSPSPEAHPRHDPPNPTTKSGVGTTREGPGSAGLATHSPPSAPVDPSHGERTRRPAKASRPTPRGAATGRWNKATQSDQRSLLCTRPSEFANGITVGSSALQHTGAELTVDRRGRRACERCLDPRQPNAPDWNFTEPCFVYMYSELIAHRMQRKSSHVVSSTRSTRIRRRSRSAYAHVELWNTGGFQLHRRQQAINFN